MINTCTTGTGTGNETGTGTGTWTGSSTGCVCVVWGVATEDGEGGFIIILDSSYSLLCTCTSAD